MCGGGFDDRTCSRHVLSDHEVVDWWTRGRPATTRRRGHAHAAAAAASRCPCRRSRCPRVRRCATSSRGATRTAWLAQNNAAFADHPEQGAWLRVGPRRAHPRALVRPLGLPAARDRRTPRGVVLDQGPRTAPRPLRRDLRHLGAPGLPGPQPGPRHGDPGSRRRSDERASTTRCSSSTIERRRRGRSTSRSASRVEREDRLLRFTRASARRRAGRRRTSRAAASAVTTQIWRSAQRTMPLRVNQPIAAPHGGCADRTEADRPQDRVARGRNSQGRSGMNAPTAKENSDEIAAAHGEPVADGSTPSSSRACVRKRHLGVAHEVRRQSVARARRRCRARRRGRAAPRCSASGDSARARRSTSISYSRSSFWARIERYSPLAIEKPPATSPARPARRTTL